MFEVQSTLEHNDEQVIWYPVYWVLLWHIVIIGYDADEAMKISLSSFLRPGLVMVCSKAMRRMLATYLFDP